MQKAPNDIILFLIVVSGVIVCMIAFIIFIIFLYKKRQNNFEEHLEQIKSNHDKIVLNTQLEIQEQTFQNISREIHDNITLSLTLAKLQLNTMNWENRTESTVKVNTAVDLLTKSIAELGDISKGLNADIIIQQGLLKALEDELARIRFAGLFTIEYSLTGSPVYLDAQKELIIFRIVQESFNNIIKHAKATAASLLLHYTGTQLSITIADNGTGFDTEIALLNRQAGLKNMDTRAGMLGGRMNISSQPGKGTTIHFTIPFNQHD